VVFSNILELFFMASNLRKVSEILHDMVEEFRKSNDEWEKRYGSTNVSRSSNDATTNEGSKQIHKGDKQDGSL
jgi:hypothetical protein